MNKISRQEEQEFFVDFSCILSVNKSDWDEEGNRSGANEVFYCNFRHSKTLHVRSSAEKGKLGEVVEFKTRKSACKADDVLRANEWSIQVNIL